MFGDAIAAAFAAACRVAGRAVSYQRGTVSVEFTACPGSSPFEAANLAEVAIHANARNYYIAASAIADFGEPEAGDSISDGAEVYRVTEMDGLPPWTWADTEHLVFRVHTKRHE